MRVLAALILATLFQGRTLYEDPTRSIRVYGYTQAEGGTLENGDFEFTMRGNPAVVESKLEGMSISSPAMSGVVAAATPSTRGFIRTLEVQGGGMVTLDNATAYQAQVDQARRLGTPVPAAPTANDVSTIKSERFAYSGGATQGTLSIPQSFSVESKSAGKTGDKTFEQTMTAQGSQAVLQLDPAAVGAVPLRSGTITGPVTLKINRSETQPGTTQPTLSELNGVADNVEIDLSSARTITLRGNVKVSGFSGLYQGTSEGDVVVVTLDDAMKPIRIRVTGEPTKSTLRERKPGGSK